MTTTLLFDDQRLNRLDNVVRKLGGSERLDDLVYRDPYGNTAFAYPSVFRHEESGNWHMVYQVDAHAGGLTFAQVVAESKDGLEWRPHGMDSGMEGRKKDGGVRRSVYSCGS